MFMHTQNLARKLGDTEYTLKLKGKMVIYLDFSKCFHNNVLK